MTMVNRLIVSLAVLTLAGYAYDASAAAIPMDTGAAGAAAASTQGLASPRADGLVDVVALALSADDTTPTPTQTPTPAPAPFAIEYRVTGTAAHCAATYENARGGTDQNRVNVPFTYGWNDAKSGAFLYMSCQIDSATDHGDLFVAIYKNGVLYKSATATAFPSSATASGSY
jgi:hypothetical protein